MRNLRVLDAYRDERDNSIANGTAELEGWFHIKSPIDRALIVVVASNDMGWDHVSVSRRNRCPNWQEMEHVKRLFFRDDETAMQLHVPSSDHVNMHPYCLHLWRPHDQEIPRPPSIFVGFGSEPAKDASDAIARVKTGLGIA